MRLRSRHRDERGAVLAIVVLSLLVILGMTALSVDVGGMLVKRRSMVTANDAAALAFAESCVLEGGGDPDVMADTLATQNADNAVRYPSSATAWTVEGVCSPGAPNNAGKVKVKYVGDQPFFFAPILGFDDHTTVAATATATWGGLGGTTNVTPLELDSQQLTEECDFPDTEIGRRCAFWYNNVAASDSWGVLNLDQWGVDPTFNCSSAGANDRSNWISGGFPGSVALKDPPPTYVCLDTGANASNWATLENEVGNEKVFPINDSTGFSGYPQVDRGGANCPDADATAGLCTPDKYSIVGFASLLIVALYHGNDPAAIGGTGSCSVTRSFSLTPPNDTYDLALSACELSNLNYPGVSTDPWPLLQKGNDPPFVHDVDYSYDPDTKIVTWLRPTGATGVKVQWDWATSGLCGVRPSDPNARCLITEYRGFTTDPGSVGDPVVGNVYSVNLTR
jgi:Flp pilus assembly protein TadG